MLYWYFNNLSEHPKCKICGKKVKFKNIYTGYCDFCSHKCCTLGTRQKAKQTCLERYGVDSYSKTEEYKIRSYKTKKQNNTFNSSKIEKKFEKYLKENNINYKTQYKSELYPFFCDFYLPDSDLYLEINAHWTHGGHPFDSTSKEDQLQLETWKSKNTKFYYNAIEIWTKRDVLKRETAKKNNLNYIEVFSNKLDKIIDVISYII